MSRPRVVILGGGPAGVAAAWKLARERKAHVALVERGAAFGGSAGSFDAAGQRLDYGSHRLSPAVAPHILSDLRALLGVDLLERPRHGRIRVRGKWIHFPLEQLDLFLRLDKRFAAGSLRDLVAKSLPGSTSDGDSFESVLRASLGRTLCEHLYFPYAVKLWGREPRELSAVQARRRGAKKRHPVRFFYPRRGYGQISEAYATLAQQHGATLRTRAEMTRLEMPRVPGGAWRVHIECGRRNEVLEADQVWSTIPITRLARAIEPRAPASAIDAAAAVHYRAMLLIYLQLPVAQFTEYEAHYFPGPETAVARLSEPKNYSAASEPRDSTVLCAELPCAIDDVHWRMSDEELGRVVVDDLARAGLPLSKPPLVVFTRRVGQAYPIYLNGFEAPFATLDRWVDSLSDVLSYGLQGLFADDHTHHALFMAYSAADCLRDGHFDRERWRELRKVFATHVVED